MPVVGAERERGVLFPASPCPSRRGGHRSLNREPRQPGSKPVPCLSMKVTGLVIAVMVAGQGCGPAVRTGQAPPSVTARGRSFTNAELGFLILTKTEQGREILKRYFQGEYLE